MTFLEYVNQTDPKRHPNVKVNLEYIKQAYQVGNEWHIVLELNGKEYSYLKFKDDDCLYTITEDGNKNKRSVFEWTGVPVRRVEWGMFQKAIEQFHASQRTNESKP